MNHRAFSNIILFAFCFLLSISCSAANTAYILPPPEIVIVGSTPGGNEIKASLTIPADEKIDFIRWELRLKEAANGANFFVLNLAYGEGQPNTTGFKGGGKTLALQGSYAVSKNQNKEIYELKSDRNSAVVSFVKLNDSVFHLLTSDRRLMVGTGGWSYTLVRKGKPESGSGDLPRWTTPFLTDDSGSETIFEGRTPCIEFAKQYALIVADCNRLKWKFILRRDPKTKQPSTYALATSLNRPDPGEGKWIILKGVEGNPDATIYQFNPDKPGDTISFFVGDDNVLFLLDKNNKLLIGDENFSYTLNRKR